MHLVLIKLYSMQTKLNYYILFSILILKAIEACQYVHCFNSMIFMLIENSNYPPSDLLGRPQKRSPYINIYIYFEVDTTPSISPAT